MATTLCDLDVAGERCSSTDIDRRSRRAAYGLVALGATALGIGTALASPPSGRDGLEVRVAALEGAVTELRSMGRSPRDRDKLEAFDAASARLERQIDALRAADTGLESQIDAINGTQSSLEGRIGVIDATGTRLRSELDALQGSVASVWTRLGIQIDARQAKVQGIAGTNLVGTVVLPLGVPIATQRVVLPKAGTYLVSSNFRVRHDASQNVFLDGAYYVHATLVWTDTAPRTTQPRMIVESTSDPGIGFIGYGGNVTWLVTTTADDVPVDAEYTAHYNASMWINESTSIPEIVAVRLE